MKNIFVLFVLIGFIHCYSRSKKSILGTGKCLLDKDCKEHEYCDHHLPNPIGDCKLGYKNGHTCLLDRHCSSKNCHHLKCVGRKPVRDGPCDTHDECIQEQFCTEKKKCKDKICHGWCKKDHECLTGKCGFFFRCSSKNC